MELLPPNKGKVCLVGCLEAGLQSSSGYLVDREGQVGYRLVILGDLCWDVGSCLAANLH